MPYSLFPESPMNFKDALVFSTKATAYKKRKNILVSSAEESSPAKSFSSHRSFLLPSAPSFVSSLLNPSADHVVVQEELQFKPERVATSESSDDNEISYEESNVDEEDFDCRNSSCSTQIERAKAETCTPCRLSTSYFFWSISILCLLIALLLVILLFFDDEVGALTIAHVRRSVF